MLSGHFPIDKNVTIQGEVTYNDISQDDIKRRLPQFVAYVLQRDKHFPTLTTLEYAYRFCVGNNSMVVKDKLSNGIPEENKTALETPEALFAQNRDAMLRGVSGGERKRVTTGEMELGKNYVKLMDEINTGLDSAATYDIIKTQRSIAKKLQKTPTPKVFELFDDVILLNNGYVMYHGPRERIVNHFESLGFKFPPERDVADSLLDLGTNQQYNYETTCKIGSIGG
ncbi:hypothetical protein PsorP6_001189 [Peronosclerospora sorghi]|uniref:Uncharacterized protein n=1 Tax=Peronosclerospora sorghi TaxID=230839 RepID=A0ACC0WU57_9STRA|nr:hypothetical protein PsorP6_001189 [Peronosclerospora sorghi]